ncbi:putative GPI transamidase component PIG-S [Xylona heveae TC161]|uniref:Putative GPI transamidase component PIG-S n=1 Tax=Xylona heveae (strain CBS 132557 / TC161) TaxID=1328760 RepID=A0A165JD48_XYLHT|nr:putative GPI transamidase component PIG-S [Xylona heveae TC161]KZF26077.1 putative GPI transamidase component PIG-S [Xylona heveae TC161]
MASVKENEPPTATPQEENGTPKTLKSIAFAKKTPPPEKAESVRLRAFVILSFWAVVIFLGLPTWWITTSIYRADLPLQEMMEWADGKACRPVFPLQILIETPSLAEADAQHLLRTTQHALDDLNEFSAHHLRLSLTQDSLSSPPASDSDNLTENDSQTTNEGEGDVALLIRLLQGEAGSSPRAELQPDSPTLDVYYTNNQIPPTSSSSSPLASFIADTLQNIFAEEQATIAYMLSANSGISAGAPASAANSPHSQFGSATSREQRPSLIRSLSPNLTANIERRSTRSFKSSPTYHLTLSLFSPNSVPSSWDIEAALEEYLSPLLEALDPLSNFTIDTQVQLYASFSPSVQEPRFDAELGAWTLRREDLSGFINAAEWPLSPSIGTGPTVNFILYVPAEDKAPLVVGNNGASSWLIPQWGGVSILNPPTANTSRPRIPEHLTKEDLRPALAVFSHQLLSLLGSPQSPSSLPLRLLTMTRVQTASLIFSASSTLGALARLTQALPSIAIPETVASSVESTITHLNNACDDLREGRFRGALQHGRIAEAEAERGFFEKSMVGQVYFPDEHKVAVYLPLLGPVGVPLIMGALKELKRVLRQRRQRQTI